MLPDRSKRYAGIDGEVPRLTLAANWQLLVIALLMGSLLMVIFPRESLVEKLYDQERLDELTTSYIENLQRTAPDNMDIAILLGRVRQERMDVAATEQMTRPILLHGNARLRAEARLLLLAAYERAMDGGPSPAALAILRRSAIDTVEAARHDNIPPRLAAGFAASAFRLDMLEAGSDLLKQMSGGQTVDLLTQYGREALGKGRHALAAEYFMLARRETPDREQARKLFQAGVGAYMAASRFHEAMQSADRNLGDLGDDPETLRYLARTALAAGEPARAAQYAQRLVFRQLGVGLGAAR